ncbi:tetratricopeptide repeat protein [Stenotrophomonas maltophilia]|uniref:tetratricopeptide repeat protein n=1 Tax=Stenotrophomonas hibiscicola TaxID=86189 RepID=UPI001D11BEC4|nr:tetratricopeptide repeat protein [Stenotrophomonas maltophilia]
MTAYVSGQAGRAVFLKVGKFFGIEIDRDDEVIVPKAQLAAYLGHAIDVEHIATNDSNEVRARLELEWSIDRALTLSLIAFDENFSEKNRIRAATDANALLEIEGCRLGVIQQLCAAELPLDFAASEVLLFLNEHSLSNLSDILDDIARRQGLIAECAKSWSSFVKALDHDPQDIARVRYRLAKIGIFRDFVTLASKGNDSILKILIDPVISSNKSLARDVVSLWASRYKTRTIPQDLQLLDGAKSLSNGILGGVGNRRVDSAFEAFNKVEKRIRAIKSEYVAAKYKRADALVNYLVGDQSSSDASNLVAKSLCNIAIFCRGIGDIDRYFSLTKRAVELVPDDAWAHIQLGNAYLAAGNYREALSSFEMAEIAGDERSALLGRGEALKAVGQQQVALSTLERCIESYPTDEVARNARASLLAYFGNLEGALAEYNYLVASPYVTSHSYGGRALVLDDLGKTERALIDIDSAIALAPDDMIPVCAKADILRRMRRYSDALAVLDIKKVSAEGRLMLGLATVRALRDSGDYKGAEKKAALLRAQFPSDINSKIASADILRRSGRFEEALASYQQHESAAGFLRVARFGYASTFAALGRYEEAASYLSTHATTAGDWVSKLLLGMIHVRQGDFVSAEVLLSNGKDECPWVRIRTQFASALIHLRLRQDRVEDASEVFEDSVSEFRAHDEGVALLAHHISISRKFASPIDCQDMVGVLFRTAMKNIQLFAQSGGIERDEVFDSEWIALTSLAA